MKRALILAPLLLAGCSQEPAATKAAAQVEPTVLILQCDGMANGRDIPTTQQRVTYRVDLEANTVNVWRTKELKWLESEGENEVEISNVMIKWVKTLSNDEGLDLLDYTIFNRQLGTISAQRTIIYKGRKSENTFNGQCVKVDEPSTERAF